MVLRSWVRRGAIFFRDIARGLSRLPKGFIDGNPCARSGRDIWKSPCAATRGFAPDKQGPATCEVVERRVCELVVNDEASPVPLRSNGL